MINEIKQLTVFDHVWVGEELVGRLCLHPVGERGEVSKVGRDDHLRADLDGRGDDVTVLGVVPQTDLERLEIGDHRLREASLHRGPQS